MQKIPFKIFIEIHIIQYPTRLKSAIFGVQLNITRLSKKKKVLQNIMGKINQSNHIRNDMLVRFTMYITLKEL